MKKSKHLETVKKVFDQISRMLQICSQKAVNFWKKNLAEVINCSDITYFKKSLTINLGKKCFFSQYVLSALFLISAIVSLSLCVSSPHSISLQPSPVDQTTLTMLYSAVSASSWVSRTQQSREHCHRLFFRSYGCYNGTD